LRVYFFHEFKKERKKKRETTTPGVVFSPPRRGLKRGRLSGRFNLIFSNWGGRKEKKESRWLYLFLLFGKATGGKKREKTRRESLRSEEHRKTKGKEKKKEGEEKPSSCCYSRGEGKEGRALAIVWTLSVGRGGRGGGKTRSPPAKGGAESNLLHPSREGGEGEGVEVPL